jgi:hypothetical protein
MSVTVDGTTYFSTTEVLREVGVARQTLWRWRQEGKIPAGHRFRDRQIFFTAAEFKAVREYANRIEPVELGPMHQLSLFNGRIAGGR